MEKVMYPLIKDKETGEPLLVRVSYNGIASCKPSYLQNDEVYKKMEEFDTLVFIGVNVLYSEQFKKSCYDEMIKIRDFNGGLKQFNNLLSKSIAKLRYLKKKGD